MWHRRRSEKHFRVVFTLFKFTIALRTPWLVFNLFNSWIDLMNEISCSTQTIPSRRKASFDILNSWRVKEIFYERGYFYLYRHMWNSDKFTIGYNLYMKTWSEIFAFDNKLPPVSFHKVRKFQISSCKFFVNLTS